MGRLSEEKRLLEKEGLRRDIKLEEVINYLTLLQYELDACEFDTPLSSKRYNFQTSSFNIRQILSDFSGSGIEQELSRRLGSDSQNPCHPPA